MTTLTMSYSDTGMEGAGLPAPDLSTVDEVMTRKVVSVRPDTSVETLAALMLERNISGLPVVDAHGQLVGMVSKTDLVRAQNSTDGDPMSPLPYGQHALSGFTVSDLMSPHVLSVPAGSPLSETARLMVEAGVHRLPVVSDSGALCGMVSTSDIVRWVAGLP